MQPTALHFLLLTVSGWVNRRHLAAIEYLREENRVLRAHLGPKRLNLTDGERRTLAVKGKALGRKALGELASIRRTALRGLAAPRGALERPRITRSQAPSPRLSELSAEQVNRLVVGRAKKEGVEDGKKSRIDSTVVDANIHHPLDSNLLFDVVRVLTRILGHSAELSSRIKFSDHTKRAKRRMLDVINARSMAHRVPIYRELLDVTGWTMGYAADAVMILKSLSEPEAHGLQADLEHYLALGESVANQTERRVFGQESVPAGEKIVSIFEPHTDVIVKDRRETLYGHKVCLNVGASGLIIDMLMERGNPADATRVIPMLTRHRELMGKVPEQAAARLSEASRRPEARSNGHASPARRPPPPVCLSYLH